MADKNELLIKINADAKNAKKAYDEMRKETEDLEETLSTVAVASGIAFAAFTAEIFFSVKAFEEARGAAVELNTALQNQGIFTEKLVEDYKSYAEAVSVATGIDDDAITSAQAVAQTYLGQTQVTQELTNAIADLGTQMKGDFNGAAEKIARTIGTGTNAFARQGLVISETATEAERYQKTLEFVQAKAGGLAAEMDKADGGARRLATAFGDFQESIGSRFAPVFAVVRNAVASFLNFISGNSILSDLTVALITAGAAVTGLATAISVAIPAFLALKAAIAALGLTATISLGSIFLIVGAVAALVAGVTLLVLNWDKAMAGMAAAARGFVVAVTEIFGGLANVIQGAITGDPKLIDQGLDRLVGSVKKTKDEITQTYEQIRADQVASAQVQDADKKAQADKEAAREREHQANLRNIKKAELELIQMQNEFASQAAIDLKTKEIENLKALDQQRSQEETALLQERREQLLALQDEQFAEDQERALAFEQVKMESKMELDAQGLAYEATIRDQRLAQIQAGLMTEADVERKVQEDILKTKIDARNRELTDRKKYGESIAAINKVLTSEEVAGVKSAAGELVALQQSKSKELKTIGQAAAVAQITIGTAESAMNIYKGFSTIPIIGPVLGIAGAAAAVLFGGERIRQVTSAADGGLIEGGVSGRDSVPAMLMPGELVVPRKNFNEVVGAVQGEGAGMLDQQILDVLTRMEDKLSTPQTNIIQGDVMTDESYVDAFCKKISDAVEFRNVRIFGVNI